MMQSYDIDILLFNIVAKSRLAVIILVPLLFLHFTFKGCYSKAGHQIFFKIGGPK